MRRIKTTLGTLAAGALLALAMPAASANAAQGPLFINDMPTLNPVGCVAASDIPSIQPLRITNMTDEAVLVRLLPDCLGNVTTVVLPGQSVPAAFGSSVEVLDAF